MSLIFLWCITAVINPIIVFCLTKLGHSTGWWRFDKDGYTCLTVSGIAIGPLFLPVLSVFMAFYLGISGILYLIDKLWEKI